MGAWIETPASRAMPPIRSVAHYVGAWIETKVSADSRLSSTSHPTWVRGLKQQYHVGLESNYGRTLRGCVD